MKNFNPDVIFVPWMGDVDFKNAISSVSGNILVPEARCWTIWNTVKRLLAIKLEGEYWECGVFRGGSGSVISHALRQQNIHPIFRLFDTFSGIPFKDNVDKHCLGDFSNTSLEYAKGVVNYDNAVFHKGTIPDTFAGLESSKIVFCHIDVDMYKSVKNCCEFVWSRLAVGGAIVFDDYAVLSCPGARCATDEFFIDKRVHLIQGANGEAVAYKPPQEGDTVMKVLPAGWTYEVKSPNIREWNLGRLKVSWKSN